MELEILRPTEIHGEYFAEVVHHPSGCCHVYEEMELRIDFQFVEKPPFEDGCPHIYVGRTIIIDDECNLYCGINGPTLLPRWFEWAK